MYLCLLVRVKYYYSNVESGKEKVFTSSVSSCFWVYEILKLQLN